MKDIIDCNWLLTVPNGQQISLNQCIMSVKTQYNYWGPLFLGVDDQENGWVIVMWNKSMSKKEEAFLAYLGLYLEHIYIALLYGNYSARSK